MHLSCLGFHQSLLESSRRKDALFRQLKASSGSSSAAAEAESRIQELRAALDGLHSEMREKDGRCDRQMEECGILQETVAPQKPHGQSG